MKYSTSIPAPFALKDDCRCGHDRVHHYKHTDETGVSYCNCLAMRCECEAFWDPKKPPPAVHTLPAIDDDDQDDVWPWKYQ